MAKQKLDIVGKVSMADVTFHMDNHGDVQAEVFDLEEMGYSLELGDNDCKVCLYMTRDQLLNLIDRLDAERRALVGDGKEAV